MKYVTSFRVMMIATCLLILSACQDGSVNEMNESFTKVLKDPKVKDLNTSIVLRLDPFERNSLLIGEPIYLEIANQSNKKIYFSSDQEIQIFTPSNSNKSWIELENSVNSYGDGTILVPQGEEGLQTAPVLLRPVVDKNQEYEIRVAVTGFIVLNGIVTDEPVSAYLDLKLKQRDGLQGKVDIRFSSHS